jgi:hypothetical protein
MANSLARDELEFVQAIEKYKKDNAKLFLSWTEVLEVVKSLGYIQSAQKKKGSAGSTARKKSGRKASVL